MRIKMLSSPRALVWLVILTIFGTPVSASALYGFLDLDKSAYGYGDSMAVTIAPNYQRTYDFDHSFIPFVDNSESFPQSAETTDSQVTIGSLVLPSVEAGATASIYTHFENGAGNVFHPFTILPSLQENSQPLYCGSKSPQTQAGHNLITNDNNNLHPERLNFYLVGEPTDSSGNPRRYHMTTSGSGLTQSLTEVQFYVPESTPPGNYQIEVEVNGESSIVTTSKRSLNCTQVEAGASFTCASLSDGVHCWGANANGQLGINSTTIMPNVATTSTVQGLTVNGQARNVLQIAAGGNHACALLDNGATSAIVKCWGLNSSGQLGDGTTTQRLTAVQVSWLPEDITSIAAGGATTCAVRSTGLVYCWGNNDNGQLGDGTTNNYSTPQTVSSISNAIAVSVGLAFSCARLNDGYDTVSCWGDNDNNELGRSGSTSAYETSKASVLTDTGTLTSVTALATGANHSCAVSGSETRCWGKNHKGQMASGATSATPQNQALKAKVSATPTYVNGAEVVSAGYTHVCASFITGKVRCWGEAHKGQLGNGTTWPNLSVASSEIDYECGSCSSGTVEEKTIDLSLGNYHSCSVVIQQTSTGGSYSQKVRCWGKDDKGQVGDDSTLEPDGISTPVTVLTVP